jgi:hypothetical protein
MRRGLHAKTMVGYLTQDEIGLERATSVAVVALGHPSSGSQPG